MARTKVYRRYKFAASHQLPHHKGKCKFLHGHNWTTVLCLEGPVPTDGMVIDFDILDVLLREIMDGLDHKHLNNLMESPTCENMAKWIFGKVTTALARTESIHLRSVTVSEDDDAWAEFTSE